MCGGKHSNASEQFKRNIVLRKQHEMFEKLVWPHQTAAASSWEGLFDLDWTFALSSPDKGGSPEADDESSSRSWGRTLLLTEILVVRMVCAAKWSKLFLEFNLKMNLLISYKNKKQKLSILK